MFFTGSLFTLSYVFIFVTQIYAQLELSEELWNENIITAEAVYKSAFIQAIKGNNLDEVIFRKKFQMFIYVTEKSIVQFLLCSFVVSQCMLHVVYKYVLIGMILTFLHA